MALSISLFRSFLWLLSACIISGAPHQDSHDQSVPVDKRQGGATFAITGVQTGLGPDGSPPERLEIRTLRENNAQWNLYLLGLNKLQSTDQSERTSYYQMAGIHGRPFIPWDGVAITSGQGGAYCPHSTNLFATWHRPYLALYEQALYDIVQDIARTFTGDDADEYASAASTFRIPYWDWAASPPAGQSVLPPPVSGSPWIQLTLTNGTIVIPNPLYQYVFHPLNPSDFPDTPFNEWTDTLRYPTSDNSSAQSQDGWVATQLAQSQVSYGKRFKNLLQSYPNYENFSNEGWIPNSPGSYDSLESLHDQIHGLVGNGGHMSYIEYSGFDPIFWLHHANVDRLFAIWQAVYADSWVVPEVSGQSTATIKVGDTLDASSSLTPFHKDTQGTFWDSDGVRDTSKLGYTYAETGRKDPAAVMAAVNALYTDNDSGKTISRRADAKSYREWICNIRVSKTALNSTFFVHVFIGEPNSDPTTWATDPHLVGTHTIFNPYAKKSDDDTKQAIVTGTIPLTDTLIEHDSQGKVDMGDAPAILSYLNKNLKWKLTRMNNTPVDARDVTDLKVSIVSSMVTKSESDSSFPTWGEFTVHRSVTAGMPGGLGMGDPS